MNYKRLTGKSIQESFDEFHTNNPIVYEMIEEQVLKAYHSGKKKISIKMIINWIRWNTFLDTTDNNSTYRINDAYTSRYARIFIDRNPSLSTFIEIRDLRS